MSAAQWKDTEKKIARRAFDKGLQAEIAELIADFKARAQAAKMPADLWEIERYLGRAGRELDRKYEYSYSRLELLFGQLLREKRISEEDLAGLAPAKLETIRLVAY